MSTWSAPVRFAEVDQQGVVFNAHYLLYCDETMSAFFAQRDLTEVAANTRLVSSTLTWTGPARWGDIIGVDARCSQLGRTSFTMNFEVRAGGQVCCRVETVYVLTDADGVPTPVPEAARAAMFRAP